jgi:ABC-type transport system involved in multi-copper enzyme maturation permease subunit
MTRLIGVELFKLRRRILTKVLAAIIVLLAVIVQCGRWQGTEEDYSSGSAQPASEITFDENGRTIIVTDVDEEPPEASAASSEAESQARREEYLRSTVPDNLDYIRFVGLILGVMLVAGAIGSEYSYGTLRSFLTCAESREKYLGAKLIALGMLIVAGLVLSLALGIALSLVFALANGGLELGFVDGAYLSDAFYDFCRMVFVVTPYLLIAALAAVIGRSAMVGAVVGLILFAIEGGVSAWLRFIGLDEVANLLLLWNAEAVLGAEGEFVNNRFVEPPDPFLAASVLLFYCVAAAGLSLWVFNRRDVTG